MKIKRDLKEDKVYYKIKRRLLVLFDHTILQS